VDENKQPVVYVYEVQAEPHARGMGVGTALLQVQLSTLFASQ
jgi:hypothetical protein